jgi:hypothetical protein
MTGLKPLVAVAAALELLAAICGFAFGGPLAAVAAFVGASLATAAQVAALVVLGPAMKAETAKFQQAWVLGMGIRFGSFLLLAVLVIGLKGTLPPLAMGLGYLGAMLALLFAETRFLR